MDRFLALTTVGKSQLQILAAACLLLASKLREPSVRGLPADLLVFYTDNSITTRDLIVSRPCISVNNSHFRIEVINSLPASIMTCVSAANDRSSIPD